MTDDEPSVTITIEGVADSGAVAEIHNAIRAVCRDAHPAGRWVIALAPSESRGCWDFTVKTPLGRHIASFASRPEQLPETVVQHLRRVIARVQDA